MKSKYMDKPLIIDDDLEEFENVMPILPDTGSEDTVDEEFGVDCDD